MQSPDFENNLRSIRKPDQESDDDDGEPDQESAEIESIFYRIREEVGQELYGGNQAYVHKMKDSKLETHS